MKTIRVDVAVIGAGTAGMTAYRSARKHGKRVVMIEGGAYGTTCARVGCMPSKLLIAAAEAAHAVAAAPAFGVHPGAVRIDGAAVMARVRAERDRFVGFVLEAVEEMPAADKIRGRARFIGPGRLQVDEHTVIEAASVVIASGSTAIVPEAWRGAGARVVISDDVFDWSDLPASVAVVGSGVIGLELGQALHRLGVRVALYARGAGVAQLSDPQVLATAARALGGELDLRMHTRVAGVERDGDGVLLRSVDAAGVERAERYDYVLAAIGRRPNVAGIGLELAGVALDARGVPLYDRRTMQCGDSAVFIAGDADNERPVLPEAADQGHIAGDNAARYPAVRAGLRRAALAVAFCEPQIATVGARHKELCLSHAGGFAVGAVSFENQGRSRVMLQNRGMLRVYGEFGSGRFLGAEMVGPRAEHLGHLLAWACQAGLTVAAMLDMPFYHPVVEEGVRTALRELLGQLSRGAAGQLCPDCIPGA
ncbi:dihydrolipoyl dehydrogenase [Janthinobacterium sp.]|uniref:dihydrolipoyl dehydrogenase n=1 Tax=Janthinobacterium sp. TaxID=1871054 RepID=UPI00293D8D1A|nr:dihydrolipoyl dehydrogenase [Janthinobacterium sp.]